MTKIRLVTISQVVFLSFAIHTVSFAYLLNAHSNPELARTLVRKFRDRQHRLD